MNKCPAIPEQTRRNAYLQIAENALKDGVLYESIVNHQHHYSRIGGIDYNELQTQTIDFLPNHAVIDSWRSDYLTMKQQMIYEANPPSFDELITDLTKLRNRINSLPWIFEKLFPQPITIRNPIIPKKQ